MKGTRAFEPGSEGDRFNAQRAPRTLWRDETNPLKKRDRRITYLKEPARVSVFFLRGATLVESDTVLRREVKDLDDSALAAYLQVYAPGLKIGAIKRVNSRQRILQTLHVQVLP